MTTPTASRATDVILASPRHIFPIGILMGQLRTANKRHNRAIRAQVAEQVAAKAETPAPAPSKKAKS